MVKKCFIGSFISEKMYTTNFQYETTNDINFSLGVVKQVICRKENSSEYLRYSFIMYLLNYKNSI
jgi:hypothetical protein